MTTTADVLAAVGARLTAAFDDPAVAVWPDGPPDATGTPAVWPEVLGGGGPGSDSPLRPVSVRVVYVPAPRAGGHADLVAAADALNAAFAARLDPAVAYSDRVWRIDAVDVGGVTHDAVLYDLNLSHHLTC